MSERRAGRISATGQGPGRSPAPPVIWSCGFPSCAVARSSRVVGAAPAGRSVLVRGGDGGVFARHVDPQGRRFGQSARGGHRDTEVSEFRDRPLFDQRFPYVFLDATYCKARVNHRVVSHAVVIATGVAADGRREVLGFDVGDSENLSIRDTALRDLPW